MDLTLDQAALSRALQLAARIAPARPTLPILQMVLLAGEPGRLRLTATDGELAVTTAVAADVAAPGRVALPARLLGKYAADLPAGPVRLTLDPDRHRVRAAGGRFVADLATADADAFPEFPAVDEGAALTLDARRLRTALERVAFAAARDDHRPVLSAVLFDVGAGGLTLAAADGFRLARARLPEAGGPERQLLVPARAVAECSRLLADAQAARLVPAAGARGVALVVGETALYARLLEGAFPDVGRVIPQEWRTRVTVDAQALRQAVRLVGLFGTGAARPVRLEAAPGRLRLRGRGDETGEAESELGAAVEGEPQAVALDARLVGELLDAVPGGRVELRWAGPLGARRGARGGPRGRGRDAADLWVVMPLHDEALAGRQAEAA